LLPGGRQNALTDASYNGFVIMNGTFTMKQRAARHLPLKRIAALASMLALAAPGAALAQGQSARNWQGVYIGGQLGGAFGSAAGRGTSGYSAGAHVGVNGQFDKVVIGVETDANITSNGQSGFGSRLRQGANGSMRARAGYAFDRAMVYGTAGIAVSNFSLKNAAGSATTTRAGSVFGVGAEAMLTENIAVRGEILRYNYAKSSFSGIGGPSNVQPATNVVRGGLSYHF
jgi:outer membrane immunogenic protein